MRALDVINKKRVGAVNTALEIAFMVNGFVSGDIPDYQMSAWLMAICLRGMTQAETESLTRVMISSGETLELASIPGIKADKHSTGGVGDTTTLIAAPLAAACGVSVAKLSGRGLGATGGTIDKLESIPKLDTECSPERFEQIIKEIGLCVAAQTKNIVPADRLMYALRDVTGTSESIPLIASSIMSKKIASGADVIMLDVKFGNGAFMKTFEDAEILAHEMVSIGSRMGRKTMAVLTDMNEPLGMAIGNGVEMYEAIETLSGRIDADTPLMQVSIFLVKSMLMMADAASSPEHADALISEALYSGRAKSKLRAMCGALGGDTTCFDEPSRLIRVKTRMPVHAGEGYVASINAEKLGKAACLLGAGRQKKADVIDHAVGIIMHKRIGDHVLAGEPLATLLINDDKNAPDAFELVKEAFELSGTRRERIPTIRKIIKY